MGKCILVIGNLTEGFRFVGPFSDFDEAVQFSEGVDMDNWVATLEAAPNDWGTKDAATPELLEACRLLVLLEDEDVHECDTRWKEARKMMRSAIAKADGRDE